MRMKHREVVFLFAFVVVAFPAVELHGGSLAERQTPFQNISSVYFSILDDIYYYLSASENVTIQCRNDSRHLLDLASKGDTDALKILDATGKPLSGILEGGVFFIGFYSECVGTLVEGSKTSFRGRYCLLEFNFSAQQEHSKVLPRASWLVLEKSQKPPVLGICLPSSCLEEDLTFASKTSVYKSTGSDVSVSTCHTEDSGFVQNIAAMIVSSLYMTFLIFTVFATCYDYYLKNMPPSQNQEGGDNACTANIGKSVSTEILCKVEKKREYSTPQQCIIAFSWTANASRIAAIGTDPQNIRVLHGIRFFSMVLIIFGHTFAFASQYLFIRNPMTADNAPKDFASQVFANGTFAVDTFYFISGLLTSYVTLKSMKERNGQLPLLYFYIHRYCRLTPLLLAVIGFCAVILPYIGSGPNWFAATEMYDSWCRKNWYLNALYLQNFVHTEEMCLSHSWYLATDMQFYLVAPLILIPLHSNFKYGMIMIIAFLLGTTLATAFITTLYNYPAIPYINDAVPLELMNGYYKDVYIKPYCRMGPYIVGILFGYFILHKKELIIRKMYVVALWTVSVTVGLLIIYLMWPANQGRLPSNAEAAAYSSLSRTVWGVTLGWLIIACYYGYGGFINKILSWPPLVPFSRLTYSAYLIHPVVMNAFYGCFETTVDFSTTFLIYLFLGNLCVTYFLSFILSSLFEYPFIGLEKALLAPKKRNP